MKAMGKQEIEKISRKYQTAIENGDYKEARKLNNILYENEFNRYLELIKMRRGFMSSGGGLYSNELAIKKVLEGLENLLEAGLKFVERENRGKQK